MKPADFTVLDRMPQLRGLKAVCSYLDYDVDDNPLYSILVHLTQLTRLEIDQANEERLQRLFSVFPGGLQALVLHKARPKHLHSLAPLTQLRSLTVSTGNLYPETSSLQPLTSLTALTELVVRGCKLTDVHTVFDHMTCLRRLVLPPLDGALDLTGISRLQSLEQLSLPRTHTVTEAWVNGLSSLKTLTGLTVLQSPAGLQNSWRARDQRCPEGLSCLRLLCNLRLEYTVPDAHIVGALTNLTELIVRNIQPFGLAFLWPLTRLVNLSLKACADNRYHQGWAHSPVLVNNREQLAPVAQLGKLTRLELEVMSGTDADIGPYLRQCTSLRQLVLNTNALYFGEETDWTSRLTHLQLFNCFVYGNGLDMIKELACKKRVEGCHQKSVAEGTWQEQSFHSGDWCCKWDICGAGH